MKTVILLALCLCGLLSCPGFVLAFDDGDPEVTVLVQNASAVCIGRVTYIKDLGPAQVDLGYTAGGTNRPAPVDARNMVAEVDVQSVLKGKISPKSITVAFYKNVSLASNPFNPQPFTELATGETDIIFLKAIDDEGHFTLSQPSSHGKSKITIGDVKIGPVPAAAMPLRAVLLTLVNALASGGKPVKLECLNRIGSAGVLLYAKAGVWVDKGAVEVRSDLGEALMADNPSSSLEAFIRARILPAVLKLTTDSDVDVRDQAILTAGRLQDVDVIPALAKLAEKQYKPGFLGMTASIFGEYRNPEATRALVGVLGDTNPNVRERAAYSLRESADPLAVPFLLDHLDDPDPDTRYSIVAALYMATNTPLCPGPAIFQAKEDQYIAFCKKWAAEHQEKVDLLRAQFLAPLPTKAVQ